MQRSMNRRGSFGSSTKLYRPEFDKEKASSDKSERLWTLMAEYLDAKPETIQKNVVDHLEYTLAHTRFGNDRNAFYRAAAYSVRDRLIGSLE